MNTDMFVFAVDEDGLVPNYHMSTEHSLIWSLLSLVETQPSNNPYNSINIFMLQTGRSQVQVPMRSLISEIYIILRAATWSGVYSASKRNEYDAFTKS
jgi:hypothetical protein